jgi:predicted glycoside hydrolase/deacetylase ChbG (UPF0249 family)
MLPTSRVRESQMTAISELLGRPSDTKFLIIHADDFGMCHSVNLATIAAFESGGISSASIMVPCPWFSEAARFIMKHPQYDVGVHITLTSEWPAYRWGPVLKTRINSPLVDEMGYFLPRSDMLPTSPEEIEVEIIAQVELAKRNGVNPSHLDCHMFALARPHLIGTYVRMAKRFNLPCLIDSYWHSIASSHSQHSTNSGVIVDAVYQAIGVEVDELEHFYLRALNNMKPGLNQLIVHPGLDDAELRGIAGHRGAFGASWRQRDLEVLNSGTFASGLAKNHIQIINWTTIRSLLANVRDARPT